jgi:hypothetical protein
MGAFGLERAAQGTAGTAKRAGGVPDGIACQASSNSRSKATACPPLSDGGVWPIG